MPNKAANEGSEAPGGWIEGSEVGIRDAKAAEQIRFDRDADVAAKDATCLEIDRLVGHG